MLQSGRWMVSPTYLDARVDRVGVGRIVWWFGGGEDVESDASELFGMVGV